MKNIKPAAFAVMAFLAAWQGTDFALDYRSVLGSIVAAALGYASPKTLTQSRPLLRD